MGGNVIHVTPEEKAAIDRVINKNKFSIKY